MSLGPQCSVKTLQYSTAESVSAQKSCHESELGAAVRPTQVNKVYPSGFGEPNFC